MGACPQGGPGMEGHVLRGAEAWWGMFPGGPGIGACPQGGQAWWDLWSMDWLKSWQGGVKTHADFNFQVKLTYFDLISYSKYTPPF